MGWKAAYGTFYTATETDRAPRASCWLRCGVWGWDGAFGETPMRASPADYKSALPACRVQLGAPRPPAALFMRRPRRSRAQGIVLAKMWCLGLGWCFWGDAHAGVSCRLQVGAPSLPSTTRRAMPPAALFTRRPRRSRTQGIMLAKMWCLGLGWCFWGDAHTGVSCRLQVGAPRPSSHEPPWLMGVYCQAGQEQKRLRSP